MDDLCKKLGEINWRVMFYLVPMIGLVTMNKEAKDFYIKKLEETIEKATNLLETIKNL